MRRDCGVDSGGEPAEKIPAGLRTQRVGLCFRYRVLALFGEENIQNEKTRFGR